MKSYTDLEQSKKLAEFLPLESADCFWDYDEMQKFHRISWFEDGYNKESQLIFNENNVCSWSLAALLEQLKSEIILENKQILFLHLNKYNDINYEIRYTNSWSGEILIAKRNNLVDACVDMIIQLKENKMI